MSQNFLKFLLFSTIFASSQAQKIFLQENCQKFSLLRDISCAVAADELAKHPEMRTIALMELQNGFPKTFSAEILKCLPKEVKKLILQPHELFDRNYSLQNILPKESMVIYVADKIEKVKN